MAPSSAAERSDYPPLSHVDSNNPALRRVPVTRPDDAREPPAPYAPGVPNLLGLSMLIQRPQRRPSEALDRPSRPLDAWAIARWVPAAASALAAAFACYLLPPASRLNDLRVYVLGGHVASQLGNVYQATTTAGYPFTYPPFAALAFVPFSVLPLGVTEVVWLLLSVIAYLVIVQQVVPKTPRVTAVVLSTSLAWTIPVRSDFRFGQIEIFLVLAVLLDLRHQGRGKGALVGLAAAFKLTPGLFILYYFASRQYRTGVTALTSFVAVTALASALLPRESYEYFTKIMLDYHRYGVVHATGNQSMTNMLGRLGTPWHDSSLVIPAADLAVVAVALYRTRHVDTHAAAYLVAVLGCASALISPVSWTHHFIWLLPAVVLFAPAVHHPKMCRLRIIVISIAAIGAALLYCSPLLRFASLTAASFFAVLFVPSRLGATQRAKMPPSPAHPFEESADKI